MDAAREQKKAQSGAFSYQKMELKMMLMKRLRRNMQYSGPVLPDAG